MRTSRSGRLGVLNVLSVWMFSAATASALGCGSSGNIDGTLGDGGDTTGDGTTGFDTNGDGVIHFESGFDADPDAPKLLVVTPSDLQTLTFTPGSPAPSVAYHATFAGSDVSATWAVDRGEVGTISPSGVFTASGGAGGLVNVTATFGGQTAKRQVLVNVSVTQSGPTSDPSEVAVVVTDPTKLLAGGGVGGVGGEGLGPAPTGATATALAGAPADDGTAKHLAFLYPYDKTVWPRGLRAPLIQWAWDDGDVDGIELRLSTTSGSYSWTGAFAKPTIAGARPFSRHPIPQDVWDQATNTAGELTVAGVRDGLTLELRVAKGGVLHGPITEHWVVAPARLAGTVYYNSYGTRFVKNSVQRGINGDYFGAAVLGIKVGGTDPFVVAGDDDTTPGEGRGCRVCHTVSSKGDTLLVMDGTNENYQQVWQYDLKGKKAPFVVAPNRTFAWAGLTPDGLAAFVNGANLAGGETDAALYKLDGATPSLSATTGIGAGVRAGAPIFSSDGKHLAFDLVAGSVDYVDPLGTVKSLVASGSNLLAFNFDPLTGAFSGGQLLYPDDGTSVNGFPSFLPTEDAVVFHHQFNAGGQRYETWQNSKAQIWWSDFKTAKPTSLDQLNGIGTGGVSYLPTGPNHDDDTRLNYEPTVLPVAGGGYAWVVFTSRRLYGTVATNAPYQSDPRKYDISQIDNVTTKKLWVAAIDLSAPGGTDPSHPAFYLPAQELAAGNSRGFWVLDPCKSDGTTCGAGDECCGGYCQPGTTGSLVCSGVPVGGTCGALADKCTTDKDCCDSGLKCIGGFCAEPGPA